LYVRQAGAREGWRRTAAASELTPDISGPKRPDHPASFTGPGGALGRRFGQACPEHCLARRTCTVSLVTACPGRRHCEHGEPTTGGRGTIISPESARSIEPPRDATEAVLGVDTHRDFHVAAVLAMTGRTLGIERFPAAASGYQQLHAWAAQLGDIRRAGVESSGNYGAALSRYLLRRVSRSLRLQALGVRLAAGEASRTEATRKPLRVRCSAVVRARG
jgi:hypothetical protein